MLKTTLKTFLCSFVVSLSAILTADRVFFYTPETPQKESKIYSKNIVLFLKSDKDKLASSSVQPIKRIALTTSIETAPQPVLQDKKEEQLNDTKSKPINIELVEDFSPEQDIVLAKKVFPLPNNEDTINQPTATEKQDILDIPIQNKKEDLPNKKEIQLAQAESVKDDIVLETPETLSLKPSTLIVQKKEKGKDIILKKVEQKNKSTPKSSPNNNFIKTAKIEESTIIPLEKQQNNTTNTSLNIVKNIEDEENNSVALNVANTPIKSMKSENVSLENNSKEKKETKSWISMAEKEKKNTSEIWNTAQGNSFSKNSFLNEKNIQKQNKEVSNTIITPQNTNGEIQLAGETIQNLLIPIPEEIMNEENIVPQLISSPKNKGLEAELEAKGLVVKKEEDMNNQDKIVSDTPNTQKEGSKEDKDNSGGILKSLSNIFSDSKQNIEVGESPQEETDNSLFSAFSKKQKKFMSKILPTEIRLSFQPNRAEISGQTLKWIKAFAQKTAEENNVGLEIRIDGTSSPLLQRRRLNLLHNILLSEGANPQKIKTVFTAREPNSFILRTILVSNKEDKKEIKNKNQYIQW